MYTSKLAVLEFLNALETWVDIDSSGFIRHPILALWLMNTDITTIEELTICCRWVESGVPEEHFIEILHLKKANAESICSALVEYCREKNIQLGRLIGMGFDGAATFSGDKTEQLLSLVTKQELKEGSHSHLIHCFHTAAVMSFNWLLCKLLMLHQVSSMSATF